MNRNNSYERCWLFVYTAHCPTWTKAWQREAPGNAPGWGEAGEGWGEFKSWCNINWFLQLSRFQVSEAETFLSPDQSVQFAYQRSTKTRLLVGCFFGIRSGGRSEEQQLRLKHRKDEQLSVLHHPRSGWIRSSFTVPAEEPSRSSQEEASGLLLYTHLTQGR